MTRRVSVDHDEQTYSFLAVLSDVVGQAWSTLQDETSPTVFLRMINMNTAKIARQDRTEKLLLLDVFTK